MQCTTFSLEFYFVAKVPIATFMKYQKKSVRSILKLETVVRKNLEMKRKTCLILRYKKYNPSRVVLKVTLHFSSHQTWLLDKSKEEFFHGFDVNHHEQDVKYK